MTFSPSSTLSDGKYRIENIIGKGAFGVVYKAWDTSLNRLVAIKELQRDAPGTGSTIFDDYAGRFRREAQVQAQFNHPHIVHVYELIDQGDTLYLVMEYVDGLNLRDYLKEHGPLPVEEAVHVTMDVLEALDAVHAHSLDIVHRDIKPSNILLSPQGEAKLTDFGLTQVAAESMRSLGRGTHHPGTPLYMSPEQARTVDYLRPASDLYSLGCVLFEMLTGKIYKKHVGRRARRFRRAVPVWLDDLLTICLTKDYNERPESAEKVAEILQAADQRDLQVEDEGEPTVLDERQFPWRGVIRGIAVFGLLVIVIVVLAGSPPWLRDLIGSQPGETPTVALLDPASSTPSSTPIPTLTQAPPTPASTITPIPPTAILAPTITPYPPTAISTLTDTPRPTLTPTHTNTPTPPTLTSIPPVQRAKEDLARRLDISTDQITEKNVTLTEFSDSCIGVWQPDMMCLMVITSGYVIELEAQNVLYKYHTDGTGDQVVLCDGSVPMPGYCVPAD